jgi:uncharacterized RDD family membrane protein YckC
VPKAQQVFDAGSLAISPSLAGRRLAPPWRRLAAFLVDAVLLMVPTFAAAFLFSAVALRLADPVGFRAVRQAIFDMPASPAEQHAMLRALAPVLVRGDADGLPAAVEADVEAGNLDRAADRLKDANIHFALTLSEASQVNLPPRTIRLELERLVPQVFRSAAMFFVPAIYFAVATSFWATTFGKRLLGLEVVRLDGRPLTLLQGLERFGSYFAVPGTLGLGILELWRDPNRRLAHDLAAGTVVVVRNGRNGPLEGR